MPQTFFINGNNSSLETFMYKNHLLVELSDGWHVFNFFGIKYNEDPFLDMDHAKHWVDMDIEHCAGKKVLS